MVRCLVVAFVLLAASYGQAEVLDLGQPAPVGENMGLLNKFSHHNLFSGLSEVAAGWRISFIAVGFIILVGATSSALSKATQPDDVIRVWLSASLVLGVMVSVPFFVNLVVGMVEHVDEQGTKAYNNVAGTSYTVSDRSSHPMELASRLQNIVDTVMVSEIEEPSDEEARELAAAANTTADPEDPGFIAWVGDNIGSLSEGFSSMRNPLLLLRKTLVWGIMNILLGLTMAICCIILVLFESLRYFLLHMGSIVLPVFLAGLMTQSFRQQSINYVFGMIGVACWPIGWMLLNVGAEALLNAFVDFMNTSITVVLPDPPADAPVGQQLLVSGEKLQVAISSMPMTYVVQAAVFGLGLSLYLIIGTAISAVLIQRLVTSGANFFSPLAASGMQAAGSAMMLAAPMIGAAGGPAIGAAVGRIGSVVQSSSRYMDDSAPVVQSVGRPTSPGAGILGLNPKEQGPGATDSSRAKAHASAVAKLVKT